jgi:hypothetical protein
LYDAYSQLWFESEKYIQRHEDKSGLQTRVILNGWMNPRYMTLLRGYLLLIKLLGADLNFRFGFERRDVAQVLGDSFLKSGFKIEFVADLSPRFQIFRTVLGSNYQANASSEETNALLQNWNQIIGITHEDSNFRSVVDVTIDSIHTLKVEKSTTNKIPDLILVIIIIFWFDTKIRSFFG